MDVTTTGLRELHLYAHERNTLLHYIRSRAEKLEHGEAFSIAVHCKENAAKTPQCVIHTRLFSDGKLIAVSSAVSYDVHLAVRKAFNALERQVAYYRATRELEEHTPLTI